MRITVKEYINYLYVNETSFTPRTKPSFIPSSPHEWSSIPNMEKENRIGRQILYKVSIAENMVTFKNNCKAQQEN